MPLFKILNIVAIMMLWSSCAFAAPFLTCDCTPEIDGVTSFEYTNNASAPITAAAVMTCGSGAQMVTCTGAGRTMCVDLASLPNGAYSFKAKAKNVWGSSADSVPLSGSKNTPTTAPSLRITP